MCPLRLFVPNSSKELPAVVLTHSWKDVRDDLFLQEYVDPVKAAEVIALIVEEKRLVAKRLALFSSLKREVGKTIEGLTKEDVNQHLMAKYPEEYL